MINELEGLALAINFLTKAEAKDIIIAVNSKIQRVLNAHIVDVVWKEEGKRRPILECFATVDTSDRPKNMLSPFEVTEESTGIWTYVFQRKQPVWIENIQKSVKSGQAINLLNNDEEIKSHYLEFFDKTDSIMALPLKKGEVVFGVYCVELPYSGKLDMGTFDFLKKLATPIANIIWKADAYEFNNSQTSEVIKRFKKIVQQSNFKNLLSRDKTVFIAQPLDDNFSDVNKYIVDFFISRKIRVKQYDALPNSQYVIENIIEQIEQSQFGIANITEARPNVMLELGIMRAMNKKLILIRDHKDTTNIPFDIQQYPCYDYKISGNNIYISNKDNSERQEITYILGRFMDELDQGALEGSKSAGVLEPSSTTTKKGEYSDESTLSSKKDNGIEGRESHISRSSTSDTSRESTSLSQKQLHAQKYEVYVDFKIKVNDEGITSKCLNDLKIAIDKFAVSCGYADQVLISEEYGSWFKEVRYRIAKFISKELQEEAIKIGQDLYNTGKSNALNRLEKPGVDSTKQIAEATAEILKAVEHLDDVVLLLGKLIVMKYTNNDGNSKTYVKTISSALQLKLESTPRLLDSPQAIIDFLKCQAELPPAIEDEKPQGSMSTLQSQ